MTLLTLARWRWTGGLTSLPEIAAGAFAQSLLGLAFHPKLLDLATLSSASQQSLMQTASAVGDPHAFRATA